ncbi:MAG: trypsin-like serine protease [Luteolibacter sp.]
MTAFLTRLKIRPRLAGLWVLAGLVAQAPAAVTATILAGGETDLPADTPSGRLDAEGIFHFVGALEISGGAGSFKGSAVAISREWVLTAGHNADLNDDGLADAGWTGNLHLPGFGVFGVAQAYTHPGFTGFANPSINDDLALLRLAAPLPVGMGFPTLGTGAGIGDVITLVGFGRSGYGSYGYTTTASLTDRRYGFNLIDSFTVDDEGGGAFEVFRYDFDHPASTGQPGGSLGNDVETIISPGDSGGAAMRQRPDGSWELVGINTFTEGYGGRFGDTGGGVLVEPYLNWISQIAGVPEPSGIAMPMLAALLMLRRRRV